MDLIAQKAVELGVYRIVPVISSRCVSRPDEKSLLKRYSGGRKLRPRRSPTGGLSPRFWARFPLKEAVTMRRRPGAALSLRVRQPRGTGNRTGTGRNAAVYRQRWAAFAASEAQVLDAGGCAATLGKRILRETAPLAALSVLMFVTEILTERGISI